MPYDSLTPEQQARADALHAAAAALGSPKDTYDDDLVRAGYWIVTGKHGAILEFFEGTPGTETHLDGGDVDLDGTTEPAPAEDAPPSQLAGIDAVEALRSSVATAGANVAEALRRGPIDGGGFSPTRLVTAADLHPSNGQRAEATLRAVTEGTTDQ